MTEYEELLEEAKDSGTSIIEKYDLSGTRLKGLYCDGCIALSDQLQTDIERSCILLEEIGHHMTSSGDITDQNKFENRKQELHARAWAYDHKIGLLGLVSAYKSGCRSEDDMIAHLNVTGSFLRGAIAYYKKKYGLCARIDNYAIYFEPLGVFELYK